MKGLRIHGHEKGLFEHRWRDSRLFYAFAEWAWCSSTLIAEMKFESILKQGFQYLSSHPWFSVNRARPDVAVQKDDQDNAVTLAGIASPQMTLIRSHRSLWRRLVRDDELLVYRNAWSESGPDDHRVYVTGLHRIQPLGIFRRCHDAICLYRLSRPHQSTRFLIRQFKQLALNSSDRYERRLFTLMLEMFLDLLNRKTGQPHPATLFPVDYRSSDHRDASPARRFRYLMANLHRLDRDIRLQAPEHTAERIYHTFSMIWLMLDEWLSHARVAQSGKENPPQMNQPEQVSSSQSGLETRSMADELPERSGRFRSPSG